MLEKELEEERMRLEKEEMLRKEKALELRIRVFYKNKDSVVKLKKNNTLTELKTIIYAEMDVEEEWENTRLRFYNLM